MPIQSPLHRTWAPQPGEVILDGKVIITGGSGAIDADASDTPKITAARSAEGVYTLTFEGGNAPGRVSAVVTSEGQTPQFITVELAAGVVTVNTYNIAGSPDDPADGEGFTYVIVYKNSSVA